MNKLGNQGFSLLEGVLLIVLVLLVAGIGYYVYQNQPKENGQSSSSSPSEAIGQSEFQALYSYKVPAGWTTKMCDSADTKGVLISLKRDKAKNCSDRTDTILLIHPKSNDAQDLTECLTDEEFKRGQELKGWVSYECEKISVNGAEVVYEREDTGGGPHVSFSFNSTPGVDVIYYGDGKELTYIGKAKQFVNSIHTSASMD